jgi:hypothetical protein
VQEFAGAHTPGSPPAATRLHTGHREGGTHWRMAVIVPLAGLVQKAIPRAFLQVATAAGLVSTRPNVGAAPPPPTPCIAPTRDASRLSEWARALAWVAGSQATASRARLPTRTAEARAARRAPRFSLAQARGRAILASWQRDRGRRRARIAGLDAQPRPRPSGQPLPARAVRAAKPMSRRAEFLH